MTQVLFVYDSVVSSVELMEIFLGNFAERKKFSIKSKLSGNVTATDILECDVFLCSRGESPIMCELLKRARAAGRFVIFYLDDDLQHVSRETFRYPGRKKYLLEGLKYADFFLTSNRLLLEEYLPLIAGNRGAVIETPVHESQIQPRVSNAENLVVRIVYAGTSAHASNWDKFIAPIWPEITAKYGSRISMTFVGMHPNVKEDGSGTVVEFIPPMKLDEYRQFMYNGHFDVGLSPLVTNHFTERKYYNKFIEYSMCGICGVYSNCPPYTLVVRDGENGILSENNPQSWQQTLERVIEDMELQGRCVDKAQQMLREKFSHDAVYDQLAEDVPEFSNFRAPEGQKVALSVLPKVKHMFFRAQERVYLSIRSLVCFGPKETLIRIRNKLK